MNTELKNSSSECTSSLSENPSSDEESLSMLIFSSCCFSLFLSFVVCCLFLSFPQRKSFFFLFFSFSRLSQHEVSSSRVEAQHQTQSPACCLFRFCGQRGPVNKMKKTIQRQFYNLLSMRWGMLLLFVGVLVTLNSSLQLLNFSLKGLDFSSSSLPSQLSKT